MEKLGPIGEKFISEWKEKDEERRLFVRMLSDRLAYRGIPEDEKSVVVTTAGIRPENCEYVHEKQNILSFEIDYNVFQKYQVPYINKAKTILEFIPASISRLDLAADFLLRTGKKIRFINFDPCVTLSDEYFKTLYDILNTGRDLKLFTDKFVLLFTYSGRCSNPDEMYGYGCDTATFLEQSLVNLRQLFCSSKSGFQQKFEIERWTKGSILPGNVREGDSNCGCSQFYVTAILEPLYYKDEVSSHIPFATSRVDKVLTDEMKKDILLENSKGMSVFKLIRKFGLTRRIITQIIKDNPLKKNPKKRLDSKIYNDIYTDKKINFLSDKKIQEKYGISRQSIYRISNRVESKLNRED